MKKNFLIRSLTRIPFLYSLSAILLILAFPKTDIWIFSWVGLVPFFLALDGKKWQECFRIGYFLGILFFGITLYWFLFVTSIGTILLIAYLALYFAIFAIGYYLCSKFSSITKVFLLPSLWVCLEFLRAHLFSGFGWVSLGHSQYKNIVMIQIADITGVYGISFLVVMVNVALKEFLCTFAQCDHAKTKKPIFFVWIAMIAVVISISYGVYCLNNKVSLDQIKVSIIQGNVSQERKWHPKAWPKVLKDYFDLTKEAVKDSPDLIIWPETSYPGYVWEDPKQFEIVKEFARGIKIPLLIGLVTKEQEAYLNTAILISGKGDVVDQYHKLHLVPFGEYLPLRNLFPFLSEIVPIEDFQSGIKYTLFSKSIKKLEKFGQKSFAVLICFEDTVSALSREFVLRGANFLVNITNDAWFQDTKAPFMHLQASVFRSIENRRSLIRAANTGISCFIDSYGNIVKRVESSDKKAAYVEGYATEKVSLRNEKTFYTKFGDVFTYFCFGCILIGAIGFFRKKIIK